jgi:1-deoxy-D-xylulose-5-phosphate synthase
MKLRKLRILDKNISPAKLKQLSGQELRQLCGEIRRFLVATVSRRGGHLASNLGTVELIVAIHRVFSSPRDKIVFDVGHQAYTHKILTGRFEAFATLRGEGGISGFPRRSESEHDAFIGGHSGISVSAALGIAVNNTGKTIAVVGDGSFTDGAIYEGMNNAGKSRANLLVILNDNEMSISKNTGAFAAYLSFLRSNRSYYKAKTNVKNFLEKNPMGEAVSAAVSSTKRFVKNAVYYKNLQGNIFENLGFKYYGIVDGHNLAELIEVLELAKLIDEPCLIHVKTKKGKGFKPAERNSGEYHGIAAEPSAANQPANSYSDVFGKHITRLAETDERIVLISAAMKYATGCNHFNDKFPDRFYDCGIAEAHCATFAAGLAAGGKLPVFAVYSTFSQRAFDRFVHDCAIENQHAVFAIDRAGVVGEDGETHQGVFDVAMLSMIPGFTIFSPANENELKECLTKALYELDGPVAVRYPRGDCTVVQRTTGQCIADTNRLSVTYGRLAEKLTGDVLRLVQIKPIAEESIKAAMKYDEIVFFEEGIQRGGIGEAFLFELVRRGWKGSYDIKAVTGFVPAADVQTQLQGIITGSL